MLASTPPCQPADASLIESDNWQSPYGAFNILKRYLLVALANASIISLQSAYKLSIPANPRLWSPP